MKTIKILWVGMCCMFLLGSVHSQTLTFTSQNELGILPGIDDSPEAVGFALLSTNGFELDQVLNFGLTTGVKFFSIASPEKNHAYPYVPLALDLRFLLSKGQHVPVLYGRAGYAFTLTTQLPAEYLVFDQIWGGLTFGAGAGYRYMMQDGMGITFNVGYSSQQSHLKESLTETTISGYSHYLLIGAGIVFRGGQ